MKTEVPTNYRVRFFRTEVQELCTPPEDGMSEGERKHGYNRAYVLVKRASCELVHAKPRIERR